MDEGQKDVVGRHNEDRVDGIYDDGMRTNTVTYKSVPMFGTF